MGFGKVGDFSLKGEVLSSGLDKAYSAARKWAFRGDCSRLEYLRASFAPDLLRVARNVEQGQRTKYVRCRDHVAGLVASPKAYFVTLTFKPECLASTSEKTRRRYVSRALKAIGGAEYIANIDYGRERQREHYHAIVVCEKRPHFQCWRESCGYVKVKRVGKTDRDLRKVVLYTTKLARHSLKESTATGEVNPTRIIYSRKGSMIMKAIDRL